MLTSATLTVSEGQNVTLDEANFDVADPDSSSFTYTVSALSGGYFQLSSNAGVAITSFTSADLGAGLVQFVDDGNEVAPGFNVTVNDGVADSNTLTVSISYTPVNDTPVVVGDQTQSGAGGGGSCTITGLNSRFNLTMPLLLTAILGYGLLRRKTLLVTCRS